MRGAPARRPGSRCRRGPGWSRRRPSAAPPGWRRTWRRRASCRRRCRRPRRTHAAPSAAWSSPAASRLRVRHLEHGRRPRGRVAIRAQISSPWEGPTATSDAARRGDVARRAAGPTGRRPPRAGCRRTAGWPASGLVAARDLPGRGQVGVVVDLDPATCRRGSVAMPIGRRGRRAPGSRPRSRGRGRARRWPAARRPAAAAADGLDQGRADVLAERRGRVHQLGDPGELAVGVRRWTFISSSAELLLRVDREQDLRARARPAASPRPRPGGRCRR